MPGRPSSKAIVSSPTHRFVADGHRRAVSAFGQTIRDEVESEFAVDLASASFWRRVLLRIRINTEVRRRIALKAPPDALY